MLNRTPFITGVSDNIQNRTKTHLLSAYAVGKLFSGVTLPANFDLGTYTTPGVCRVSTYLDGPPVTSPGYLVVHTVNLDEEINGEKSQRVRQIYYPDDLTNTTPYSRVGVYNAGTNNYTWSVWTTLGGNWITDTLTENRVGIVGYMYHSFGPYTLTLPDPSLYTLGTRIGLTQWLNTGAVVTKDSSGAELEHIETPPDVNIETDGRGNIIDGSEPTVIGALEYIFNIVPDHDGATHKWALVVDNTYDDQLAAIIRAFQADDAALEDRMTQALIAHNNNTGAHAYGFNHDLNILRGSGQTEASVTLGIVGQPYTGVLRRDTTNLYLLSQTATGSWVTTDGFAMNLTTGRVSMTNSTLISPSLSGTPTTPNPGTSSPSTMVANIGTVDTKIVNHNTSMAAHANGFNHDVLIQKTEPALRLVRTGNTHEAQLHYGTGNKLYLLSAPVGTQNWVNTSGFAMDMATGQILMNSPNLTGKPTATTAAHGDDSTQVATTAYVQDALLTKDRRMIRHIVTESASTHSIAMASDSFSSITTVPYRGLTNADYTLICNSSKTFNLPSSGMSAGHRVVFIVKAGISITVVSGSTSETFTAPSGARLVVDMESMDATTWTVLAIG